MRRDQEEAVYLLTSFNNLSMVIMSLFSSTTTLATFVIDLVRRRGVLIK